MLFANRFMKTDYLVQKSGPEVGMWVALAHLLGSPEKAHETYLEEQPGFRGKFLL